MIGWLLRIVGAIVGPAPVKIKGELIARLDRTSEEHRAIARRVHACAQEGLPFAYRGKLWTITSVGEEDGQLVIEGFER